MGFCVMMASTLPAAALSSPRFLGQVREQVRVMHDSLRPAQAYVGWIKCYILFHGKRYPGGMGKLEVERNVSVATQTQVLSALLFLYK